MRNAKALPSEMTVEQLREYLSGGGKATWGGTRSERTGKFNNKKVLHDGQTYDSMAEFKFKLYLDMLIALGVVAWYTRQVAFWLPGGKKYKCDYLVVMAAGVTRIVDVKGVETDVFKLKQSVIQSTHRVTIEAVPAETDGRYTWR